MRDPKYSNLQKKGCSFNINNNYDKVSFSSDTIDKVDFKTIVLTISGWFIVTSDTKPTRVMNKLCENIKLKTIQTFNEYYFSNRIIDIVTTPDTFNEMRSGFLNLDYTIFVNRGVKFDKREITMLMNELIDKIYNEYFEETKDFDVFKSRIEFKDNKILWNPDEYYPGYEVDVNERL